MGVAQLLGASIPWTPRATSPKLSLTQRFFLATFDRFARAAITLGTLRFILPNGEELRYGGGAPAAQLPPGTIVHVLDQHMLYVDAPYMPVHAMGIPLSGQ